MKFLKKSNLWRGLFVVFAIIFTICLSLGNLAFAREGDINAFLKLSPPKQSATDENTLYYPSEYSNKAAMMAAEKLHDIQLQEEGTVLLHNKDCALPLSPEERSVTLFGRTSVDPIYKGAAGGSSNPNPISLIKALEDQGFSLNKTIIDALKSAGISRRQGFIAEVPVSFYNSTLQESYATNYNDVAIITFGRYGGENQDLVARRDDDSTEASMRRDVNGDPIDLDGVPMLSLHPQERELLNLVKSSGKFGKIIVILNSAYPMECQEIAEYADAILFVGNPGTYGFEGVVNCITGKADPSGRTVDTFATSSLSSPAMRNYGDFQFTNLTTLYKCKYIVYAEGIYTGYKYYETRYQDQVLGLNNATSTKGVYSGEGGWDYAEEMVYPFGYGQNYVEFTQTLKSINWDKDSHKLTAIVTVENKGAPDGSYFDSDNIGSKSVVQLYAQLPYTYGQAEKSAIQLIGFGKTRPLKKGEIEEITIEVDDYLFATYDNKAVNGADPTKTGCYVFDAGDYYFAIGNDAHDALNNIMAKKGHVGMFDANGNSVAGDATKVVKDTLEQLDNTTYARSVTGEIVCNQFDDVDINNYLDAEDQITYLTRSDWNTYPEAITGLKATEEMQTLIEGKTYKKPNDAPNINTFKYGKKDTVITKKFIEMKDVDWNDDETWNEYLDQFTLKDLYTIPGEKMANDAIPTIGIPANVNGDGPDGLQRHIVQHPCAVVAASTYNLELIEERGKIIGENAMYVGQHGVYGPGANLHRVPYNGRNQEYYSEDAVLSYLAAAAQVKGARSKGLITFIKHFVCNDQEVNRHGVCTLMEEQTLRQNYLKAFEGAFVVGESLGTMTCYNRIGFVPGGAHYGVMTQVLRNEWGFKGINMTDSSKDAASYMYTAESIAAGTNQFNNDAGRSDEIRTLLTTDKDGFIWQKCRDNLKYYTYAYLHSFVTNGLAPDTIIEAWVPWWKPTISGIIIGIGCLAGVLFIMTIVSYYVFNKSSGEFKTINKERINE